MSGLFGLPTARARRHPRNESEKEFRKENAMLVRRRKKHIFVCFFSVRRLSVFVFVWQTVRVLYAVPVTRRRAVVKFIKLSARLADFK